MSTVTGLYHPNPERFAEISQRIFPYIASNYGLARRTVSIPALLNYADYPLATNQFCFRHGGHGRALWIFRNEDDEWFFKCVDSQCGIKGDVVGMWYLMVKLSGFAPPAWNMDQACGDLMTRAERGMIDLSITELEDARLSARYPRPDEWYSRLEAKVKSAGLPVFQDEASLPRHGVQISIRQAVTAMFPDDGLLLITPKPKWQSRNIFMRDEWLSSRYTKPANVYTLVRTILAALMQIVPMREWKASRDDGWSLKATKERWKSSFGFITN